MHHRIYEDDDGNTVQEFDSEAMDYFIEGLEELRGKEVDEILTTPCVSTDVNGVPESVQQMILKRAPDVE